MYQSPIEVFKNELKTELDNETVRAVQRYYIQVNKDELIKALQYDRDQYEAGRRDGYMEGYSRAIKDIRKQFETQLMSEFDKAVMEGLKE